MEEKYVKGEEYKGYHIFIRYDHDLFPDHNPFDTSNELPVIQLHTADKAIANFSKIRQDDFDKERRRLDKGKSSSIAWYHPVYAYCHSGWAFSRSPFSCRFDSALLGFAFISTKRAKADKIDVTDQDKLLEMLDACLNEFTAYANGEVYGYEILDSDSEIVESCWGFLGGSEYCLKEARIVVDNLIKNSNGV